MKFQDICDKIIARHEYPTIMGENFILKLIEEVPNNVIIDSLLDGVDLNPFNEMENLFYPEPFNILHLDQMIIEPQKFDIQFENTVDYGAISDGFSLGYGADWPAKIIDIMPQYML